MNIVKRAFAAATAGVVCLMGTMAVSEMTSLMTMTVSAAEQLTYGVLSYEKNDTGTLTITGCDRAVTAVEIPAEIDGTAVTAIGDGAFRYCAGLTGLIIPEGITTVETGAFAGCTGLVYVSFPESLTEIGHVAFSGCTGLTDVSIPKNVMTIGWRAFYDCNALTSIRVDKNNAHYSSKDGILFNQEQTNVVYCPEGKTENYVIPDGVTEISIFAFTDCVGLNTITVPRSVNKIGEYAFDGCTGLTDIYYAGTEKAWGMIEKTIDKDENSALTTADVHFMSALELGDVNDDGVVNAGDAAAVLIAAAKKGVGDDLGLTSAQMQAADVNGDGNINASDAAVIQIYAAVVGAGQTDVRIEDFV